MTSEFAEEGDVAVIQSPYESLNQSRWLIIDYFVTKNNWDRHTSLRILRVDKDDWITDLDVIEQGDGIRTVCMPTGDYRVAVSAVSGLSGPTESQRTIFHRVFDIGLGEGCTYSGPDITRIGGRCN